MARLRKSVQSIPANLMEHATVKQTKLPPSVSVATGPPRSKFGNVRTEYKGETYDSKAEADRAKELDLLKAVGQVWCWYRQPVFHLGCPENTYRADFLVIDKEGVHVEDVKGVSTAKFNHDRRLWMQYGPCPLWVIKKGDTSIIPGREMEPTR